MREIERSKAAVENAKSWHYHTVLVSAADAIETLDADTLCPLFQRTVRRGTDQDGTPRVLESINYFGRVYGPVAGEWRLSQGRQVDMNAQDSIPIFECLKGSIGTDSNSLPYALLLFKMAEFGAARSEASTANPVASMKLRLQLPTIPRKRNFDSRCVSMSRTTCHARLGAGRQAPTRKA